MKVNKERMMELAKQLGLTIREVKEGEEAGVLMRQQDGTTKKVTPEELFPELLELKTNGDERI